MVLATEAIVVEANISCSEMTCASTLAYQKLLFINTCTLINNLTYFDISAHIVLMIDLLYITSILTNVLLDLQLICAPKSKLLPSLRIGLLKLPLFFKLPPKLRSNCQQVNLNLEDNL